MIFFGNSGGDVDDIHGANAVVDDDDGDDHQVDMEPPVTEVHGRRHLYAP